MEQENKPWVVNAHEAINRTCDAIYREYKVTVNACSKKKHSVVYKTDNETTCQDLHYFYNCVGYKVEVEELPQYKDGAEYTIYKLKLMW